MPTLWVHEKGRFVLKVDKLRLCWYAKEELNNDTAFRKMIYETIDPGSRVLDAGAGSGDLFLYDLKGRVKQIIGVDLDRRVITNPQLDSGIQADLTAIPAKSNSFDVVFSRYVLEHIAEPQPFLYEIHRVLKPKGLFLFLTPNKWHYVSIASGFTPKFFHKWFNRFRGRGEQDTFPTVYRLNTLSSIRKHFQSSGFREIRILLRECSPNYLTVSLPTFLLGVAYERIVNSTQVLAGLRVNILGCFQKK